METNIKKTIDNHLFTHKCEVCIEDDDYAIIEKYGAWANLDQDQAIKTIFNYSLRIIKNILKYHKNYSNVNDLIEFIGTEANVNLSLLKNNKELYEQLYQECLKHCFNRHQYTPYERSYWYDILLTILKYETKLKQSQPLLN